MKNAINQQLSIIIADDDADDQMMLKEAFHECNVKSPIFFVNDGDELIHCLRNPNEYIGKTDCPIGLIFLDLNMPRRDGREVLKEIKSDPKLKDLPIIVFTTSKEDSDISSTYSLGVNSFITKPVSFESLLKIIQSVKSYWLETVELPRHV